jgi:microcystin-dependent protein
MAKHLRILLCAWLMVGSWALAGHVHAQDGIPRTLSVQGVMTAGGTNGLVRPDATYQLIIHLYDSPGGAIPVWSSQPITTTTVRGMYSILVDLSTVSSRIVSGATPLWLAISEGGQEFQRMPLSSYPYALRALVADSAKAAPPVPIADASITASKIATNQVVTSVQGLQDAVEIVAGTNITLQVIDGKLHIAARDTVAHSRSATISDSATRAPSAIPVGIVMAYMGDWESVRTTMEAQGWHLCDGSALSRTLYPELLSRIGVRYGLGDSLNTFNIPDLRGYFLRGASPSNLTDSQGLPRDVGAPRAVGSYQQDAFQGHWHIVSTFGTPGPKTGMTSGQTGNYPDPTTNGNFTGWEHNGAAARIIPDLQSASGPPRTSAETRPKNIAVNYIIKVR